MNIIYYTIRYNIIKYTIIRGVRENIGNAMVETSRVPENFSNYSAMLYNSLRNMYIHSLISSASGVIGNTDSKNRVTRCIQTCDCVLSTWTIMYAVEQYR